MQPAILESLADLPVGNHPRLAYVVAGSSVVQGDRSTDLEWDVAAILGDLVYDEVNGTIHRVDADGITLVSGDATSPPGKYGAWIEHDREIVRLGYPERQPLPDGCCEGAQVVGMDVDHSVDIYVRADDGAWMWDTYEGGEGLEDGPPESEDYFWPVGGLDGGTLAAVGIASEILVEYSNGQWGWGHVLGPRDPGSGGPVEYLEQERVTVEQVWLTGDAIVALERDGTLVELASEMQYADGNAWRTLTGARTAFELPDRMQVDSVVTESRRTVLADVTDRSGARAWVRCSVRTYACEIATELGPDDITPHQ